MLYSANKTTHNLVNQFGCNVICGISSIFRMLHIKTCCCGSKFKRSNVFLCVILKFFNTLGGFTRAQEQNTGGQRVESAGMTYFDFCTKFLRNQSTHTRYQPKRSPFDGLIKRYYFTGVEIHLALL